VTNNEEKAVSVLALPVSVEQIAATVRQMGPADQKRLFDMVPELRQVAVQSFSRTLDEARASVERLRAEVARVQADEQFSPDELFLGDLTIKQYMDLPDDECARLWEAGAGGSLYKLNKTN
jgi:hypothetical protein